MEFNSVFWREYMAKYDNTVGRLYPYEQLLSDLVTYFDQDAEKVVDLGCGTGNLTLELQRIMRPHVELFACDRNPEAVKIASEKLGTGSPVALMTLDLEEDEWVQYAKDADQIFCCNVLYALQDPLAFLRGVRASLRKDGELILTNPWLPDVQPILDEHRRLEGLRGKVAETYPDFEEHLDWMYKANLKLVEGGRSRKLHFLGQQELTELLALAGLNVLRLRNAYAGVNLLVVCKAV